MLHSFSSSLPPVVVHEDVAVRPLGAAPHRTLAPRPVTFRIAAVGALPSRERLIAMATGHGASVQNDEAQGGNFFASVVSSDELRLTPATVGVAAEAAADDAATATSWNLLHDETVLPLSSFSLVVQVRFRFV